MSPLKIALLLRMYSSPRPNADLPERQAFSPAMAEALQDFQNQKLVLGGISLDNLRSGPSRNWLTESGAALVSRICRAAGSRPDRVVAREQHHAELRDEFAKAALQGYMASPGATIDIDGAYLGEKRAQMCYAMADAMLEVRNANR